MHQQQRHMIQTIEEASFNAWPAAEQQTYDGWVLRFAGGYTKRANSVNPLYPGQEDVQEKIKRCEQLYLSRNLKPVFRLTPLALPANLDEILARRGYVYKDPTQVQVLDLNQWQAGSGEGLKFWPEASTGWLNSFMQVSAVPMPQPHLDILTRIAPRKCFAVLYRQDRPVACGLGVLEGRYMGLFDIVTAPAERRKGYGRELVSSILSWGSSNGAQTAYLQVMNHNIPALNLYAQLGFREIYPYWYRIKEGAHLGSKGSVG